MKTRFTVEQFETAKDCATDLIKAEDLESFYGTGMVDYATEEELAQLELAKDKLVERIKRLKAV